ncbi:hypothetical protein DYB32_003734 [Aphanomyces invadans]|uniref:RGS domain-containing protein n=1 Tax=Aphanomyces invadans TaxID=157072 RepID=A0A3R6VNF7_9STRA|nr:hypothetical protein DYB32_003734 [Aphanomyces invadans]
MAGRRISYVLSAVAATIMFKITDLVVNQTHFTPDQVARLTLYRWLLYPKILLAWTGVTGVVGSVLSLWMARHMPPYMDNLGFQSKYRRTNRTTMFLVVVGLVHGGLELVLAMPLGQEFHVRNILFTLMVQYVFYFNITVPLRHLATSVQTSAPPSRLATITFKKRHFHVDDLDHYLQSRQGQSTFLAFCQRDFRTEEIRAWQLVEQFKQRLVSPQTLVATCLSPQCALACPTSTVWGPIYVARLESWLRQDADIVGNVMPTSFFDEFQVALLVALCEDVWPRFKRQSMEWTNFYSRQRNLEGMDRVLRMVIKKSSSRLRPSRPPPTLSAPR